MEVRSGSIAAGRLCPTGATQPMVSWLAVPVKFCAASGQLYWQGGRVAFIDARDIAQAAVAVLTDSPIPNSVVVLTGPEPLSYDDVAVAISDVAGRPVRHFRMTVNELKAKHAANSLVQQPTAKFHS